MNEPDPDVLPIRLPWRVRRDVDGWCWIIDRDGDWKGRFISRCAAWATCRAVNALPAILEIAEAYEDGAPDESPEVRALSRIAALCRGEAQ